MVEDLEQPKHQNPADGFETLLVAFPPVIDEAPENQKPLQARGSQGVSWRKRSPPSLVFLERERRRVTGRGGTALSAQGIRCHDHPQHTGKATVILPHGALSLDGSEGGIRTKSASS